MPLDDWDRPELDWCVDTTCPYWEWDKAKGTRHQTNDLHRGFIRLWTEMEKAQAEDRVFSAQEARKRLGIVYGNMELGRRKTDGEDWRMMNETRRTARQYDRSVWVKAVERQLRRRRLVVGLSIAWIVLAVVSVVVVVVSAVTS